MGDFPLQWLVDELTEGKRWGVFLDDSGSPGAHFQAKQRYPVGESWVALLIPPATMGEIYERIRSELQSLAHRLSVKEMHCKDLFSGSGPYKTISFEQRFRVLKSMSNLIALYHLPIIVQTFDPDAISKIFGPNKKYLRQCWDLSKPKDAAFVVLLWRIEEFMRKYASSHHLAPRVFVDEGYYRSGAAMSGFSAFAENSIYFADSQNVPPLQLADFAAFSVNRHQVITTKKKIGPVDAQFLIITSAFAKQMINVELKEGEIDDSGGQNPHFVE